MRKNILLTGKPGIGKTTAIKSVVKNLEPDSVIGFWSEEIREKGRRVGFKIETIAGKSGILAHEDIDSAQCVSRYGVNVEDIDSIIVPELEKARESRSIIIIDEIAKMELFSNLFVNEVRRCLDTTRVLGTIQERPHPFLNEVRARGDIVLLELTMKNRNQIPQQVLQLLSI
jgi:nucleoside-triphosphatase